MLEVSGTPYIFSVDATDASSNAMTNIVSGLGIGDTFSSGGVITKAGPVILASSDGTGASKSLLGAVLTDPQNNVVAIFNWVDSETHQVPLPYPCNLPVGLNYALKITPTNT